MYVYLSEESYMSEIDDKGLIWKKTDLLYGDWSSGPNNDGTYTIQTSFTPSKVQLIYTKKKTISNFIYIFLFSELAKQRVNLFARIFY